MKETNDLLIRRYDGNRELLRPLFREADDSEQQLDRYLDLGEIIVAEDHDEVIGHLQLIARDGAVELNSMAVTAHRRGAGVGAALVQAALQDCRRDGASRLLVATAAADIGNLRFYQRQGFRMLRVERDAFTPATGYPDGIIIDGIPLRDRVWLDLCLQQPVAEPGSPSWSWCWTRPSPEPQPGNPPTTTHATTAKN